MIRVCEQCSAPDYILRRVRRRFAMLYWIILSCALGISRNPKSISSPFKNCWIYWILRSQLYCTLLLVPHNLFYSLYFVPCRAHWSIEFNIEYRKARSLRAHAQIFSTRLEHAFSIYINAQHFTSTIPVQIIKYYIRECDTYNFPWTLIPWRLIESTSLDKGRQSTRGRKEQLLIMKYIIARSSASVWGPSN